MVVMSGPLVIIGASTRAAAMSAIAAGYDPYCIDKYADTDLQAIASVQRCQHWPSSILECLDDAPSGPLLLTGAMENYPMLLELSLNARWKLQGSAIKTMEQVRHPPAWTRVMRKAGIRVPRCVNRSKKVQPDGTWLRKPLRSAGGFGVQVWDAKQAIQEELHSDRDYFWQERIPGQVWGAVFVAAAGRAVLLGTTQHLAQPLWCTGAEPAGSLFAEQPFAFCGSIGPLHLADALTTQLQRIGTTLASAFDLQGLFGVDLVCTPEQELVPIEINPRYTASIELLERASLIGTRGTRGKRLLSIAMHMQACELQQLPEQVMPATPITSAKAILYAPLGDTPFRFTVAAAQWAAVQNLEHYLPVVADIPVADSIIEPGHPICTILADGLIPRKWNSG